jgi:glucose/arabinose dehydrogenase
VSSNPWSRRGRRPGRRAPIPVVLGLVVAVLVSQIATIGAGATVPAAAVAQAAGRLTHPDVSGLPAGFSVSTVQGNLDQGGGGGPTAFAYAPDGRIFVARKTGVLNVWDHGVQHTYIDLRDEVNSYQSRGFIGFALDPHFSTNGRVYLLFTQELNPGNPDSPAPAGGQLISLTNKPGQPDVADPASRVTLMTGFDSQATLHSVAGLRFGIDGSLFVGLGDGNGNGVGTGTSIKALDLDQLNGKILRIDPVTGNGVPSNPYYVASSPGSVRSRVFARGFRNPFRFTVDPTSGTLYVGDVGWNTWEMFQVFPLAVSNPNVTRDAGWPCYEGGNGVSLVQPDYASAPSTAPTCHTIYTPAQGGTGQGALAPLYGYRHDDPGGENGSAIAGGPRYMGTANYPSSYIGKVFIGDYARSRVQTIDLSTRAVTTFGTQGTWGNPVDMQIAPDGNIALLEFGPASLQEIVFSGSGNHPPVASAHADHTTTTGTSLTVHFSSAGSSDPDGDPITYSWNFGDGSPPSSSASPTHTYGMGAFTATLTVTDSHLAIGTATIDILVGVSRPVALFTKPTPGLRFKIGDTIPITVLAVDPQDGVLTGDSLATEVDYWTGGHRYPVVNYNGVTGSFVAADQGFVNAFYRITTTATDSDGLSTVITRDVTALTSTVTILSNPPGVTVSADGTLRQTPYSFATIIGSAREIAAPATVSRGGADFTGPVWSQGGHSTRSPFLAYIAPVGGTTAIVSYALKPSTTRGYRVVNAAGVVHGFGLTTYGDLRAAHLASPIVAMAPSPNRRGYWLLGRDGGVFGFGDAPFYGSTGGIHLAKPVVGLTAPRAGGGYWLVASDGGIFAFGRAGFFGSTGAIHLNRPIVGMTATPSGRGYWLVASDGGIFAFGDARFFGSTGAIHLNRPIVGMATTPSGRGYEFAADDGGIFTFGDAAFYGSLGDVVGAPPVVGLG